MPRGACLFLQQVHMYIVHKSKNDAVRMHDEMRMNAKDMNADGMNAK